MSDSSDAFQVDECDVVIAPPKAQIKSAVSKLYMRWRRVHWEECHTYIWTHCKNVIYIWTITTRFEAFMIYRSLYQTLKIPNEISGFQTTFEGRLLSTELFQDK